MAPATMPIMAAVRDLFSLLRLSAMMPVTIATGARKKLITEWIWAFEKVAVTIKDHLSLGLLHQRR